MKILKSNYPNLITALSTQTAQTAKLPLSTVRGSVKERYALSDKYTNQLRAGLDKLSDTKKCKVEDFKNLINEILKPNKINISIAPLKDHWQFGMIKGGSISVDADYQNKITQLGNVVIESTHKSNKGYTIKLPLSKNDTIINDKYSAFHEARHLFDYVCNPKTIDSNLFRVADSEEKVNAYVNTYKAFIADTNILGGRKLIKSIATENLSKLSDEEAIGCLQNIRHTLKTEINAYCDTANYMREKPLTNFMNIYGGNEFMMFHNYPKRLKLANQMLAEHLKQARENLKNKNRI